MEPFFTTDAADDVARRPPLISESLTTKRLYELASRAADSPVNLLIIGEPGVGKTTLARWIYTRSRPRGPLVTLKCTTGESTVEKAIFGRLPNRQRDGHPGAFESANGGTVVLKNVESLGFAAQAKLLRILETREVTRLGGIQKVRVAGRLISTTSSDLEAAAKAMTYRLDLMAHLSGFTLHLSPLRERPEDIEPFARLFIAEAARDSQAPALSSPVVDLFRSVAWPRNLTQLRDVIEAALARCEGREITLDHIDAETLRSEKAREVADDPGARDERSRIIEAFAHGNATAAAQKLGMSRRTLIEKLNLYKIPRPLPPEGTK